MSLPGKRVAEFLHVSSLLNTACGHPVASLLTLPQEVEFGESLAVRRVRTTNVIRWRVSNHGGAEWLG